jgi:hypothetical protein
MAVRAAEQSYKLQRYRITEAGVGLVNPWCENHTDKENVNK